MLITGFKLLTTDFLSLIYNHLNTIKNYQQWLTTHFSNKPKENKEGPPNPLAKYFSIFRFKYALSWRRNRKTS